MLQNGYITISSQLPTKDSLVVDEEVTTTTSALKLARSFNSTDVVATLTISPYTNLGLTPAEQEIELIKNAILEEDIELLKERKLNFNMLIPYNTTKNNVKAIPLLTFAMLNEKDKSVEYLRQLYEKHVSKYDMKFSNIDFSVTVIKRYTDASTTLIRDENMLLEPLSNDPSLPKAYPLDILFREIAAISSILNLEDEDNDEELLPLIVNYQCHK